MFKRERKKKSHKKKNLGQDLNILLNKNFSLHILRVRERRSNRLRQMREGGSLNEMKEMKEKQSNEKCFSSGFSTFQSVSPNNLKLQCMLLHKRQ